MLDSVVNLVAYKLALTSIIFRLASEYCCSIYLFNILVIFSKYIIVFQFKSNFVEFIVLVDIIYWNKQKFLKRSCFNDRVNLLPVLIISPVLNLLWLDTQSLLKNYISIINVYMFNFLSLQIPQLNPVKIFSLKNVGREKSGQENSPGQPAYFLRG